MGGKAMPEHVGRQSTENAGLPPVRGKKFPETLAGDCSATSGYKEISAGAAFEQGAAAAFDVAGYRPHGFLADRHQSLLVALAHGPQNSVSGVQVAHTQMAQFRD